MEIQKDHPNLASISHRKGVTNCPNCDFDSGFGCEEWVENAESLLTNPSAYGKPADCILISSCPECGEKSWNHFSLESGDYYDDFPEFCEAVKKEKKRRITFYKKEWDKSLCQKCVFRKSVSNGYLYYNVECGNKNWSKSGHCRNKCDKFAPISS